MLKKTIFYFLFFIIFFFIIEILTRIFLFTFSSDYKIFKYGFDKRIELTVIDFSKLNFLVIDHNSENFKIIKKEDSNNKIEIWTFGGSTTAAYCKNTISWPKELAALDKRFSVKNFAEPGSNSNYALKKFSEVLNSSKQKPDIVLWSNKDNEQFNFEQNLDVKTIIFIKRIAKTMKSNFTFAYLYDDFIFNFNKHILKIDIKKDLKTNFEVDELYDQAIKNYNKNTISAIFLAKKNNIDLFLVSLFGKFDVEKKSFYKNQFWNVFEKNAKFLEKNYKINYINTENILIKNFSDLEKDKKYFCDNTHQTKYGNKLTSKIIYDVILQKLINNR